MAYLTVFKRRELKYLLTDEQKKVVTEAMEPYMIPDNYGKSTIRNLYFDTDDFRLIRRSVEKPEYKEKLRVRSYCLATPETEVFVELKKKYKSVVYKRRLFLKEEAAMKWLQGSPDCVEKGQISKEIEYFLSFYGKLQPTVFLSYDREAFFAKDGSDFRITFDDNILCRRDRLSLTAEVDGTPILDKGMLLMEIKCSGGIPLWMTQVLSRQQLYKVSFSKYGTYYKNYIFPYLKGEKPNA